MLTVALQIQVDDDDDNGGGDAGGGDAGGGDGGDYDDNDGDGNGDDNDGDDDGDNIVITCDLMTFTITSMIPSSQLPIAVIKMQK